MKRIMHLALAATAASALAVPAFAGNLAAPKVEPQVAAPAAAAPAPAAMPAGDWTGGYVGVGLGYDSANGPKTGNSGVGSVFAGYNYDFGKFVLGGEIGANKAHAGWGPNTLTTSYDAKLKGGVGMGRTLFYGAVGAEHADNVHGTAPLIGIGVDYKLTDKILVGGEADYTHFKNADNAGNSLNNTRIQARVSFRF
ncbi:MAG: outer membrane beta-barrel protein [Paracoccaceae bacterium]|nr:outer membrane beta-barrel protein [Paracoccaceae bacterium]MDE3237576.1 outer membrane beta-barrel protein [Paracoccaceae bacterium]